MENYLRSEDDAVLVTRLAMGESRQSASDREYVIWIVRVRTQIAFTVNVPIPGQTTSVKDEVLAPGQFTAISSILNVTDPRSKSLEQGTSFACGGALNGMIYPCDVSGVSGVAPNPDALNAQALVEWQQTYYAAQRILNAPINQMPAELRTYDSFLAGGNGKRFFVNGNYYYNTTRRDDDLFK